MSVSSFAPAHKNRPENKADTQRYRSTTAFKRVTHSGLLVDYTNPRPQDISIKDIAEALAKQCRFSGHTMQFYSVAQHACLVHDLCPLEARPWALLHDAHEAYTGDLPTPLKNALHALGGGLALDDVCNRLDRAIAGMAGLTWPISDRVSSEVKVWDRVALATERHVLLSPAAADHSIWPKDGPSPRRSAISRAWTWSVALEQFLRRYEALGLPLQGAA